MSECKMADCPHPAVGRGLCRTHYQRQYRGKESHNAAVLDCIRELTEALKYPPTVRELQVCLGFKSPSTVHSQLKNLKGRGLITMEEGKARSIRLVEGKSGKNS